MAARWRSAIAFTGSGVPWGVSGRLGASGLRTFGFCCAGVGWWLAGILGDGAVGADARVAVAADAPLALGVWLGAAAALGVGGWFFAMRFLQWGVSHESPSALT
jgi:hypothetical protein